MTLGHQVTTANQPGAVAILQVHGPDVSDLLQQLTGRSDWPVGRLRLCDMAGIDEGLVTRLREDVAQLMPHGGPRVVQKLTAWLESHGSTRTIAEQDTQALYPEAASPIEADMLHAIATAASPAAIDLLAAQPALWRRWYSNNPKSSIQNQKSLRHLITPPTVVVVGRPNVGKSTLLNRLVGRSASVVADLPGTTRDWVGSLVELVPPGGDPVRDAIAVRWLDTPGLRDSDDAVEQRAIELARTVVGKADVLITMRDPAGDWPADDELPRPADLRVVNKIDADENGDETWASGVLPISAATGQGIDHLIVAVIKALGLSAISADTLWPFSPTLIEVSRGAVTDDGIAQHIGFAREAR